MEITADIEVCKKCTLLKKKIFLKTVNVLKSIKLYVDENGSHWNGRTCPDCQKEQVKLRMREKRASKN